MSCPGFSVATVGRSLSHLKVNTNVMATLVKLSSSGMFQVFIGMAS